MPTPYTWPLLPDVPPAPTPMPGDPEIGPLASQLNEQYFLDLFDRLFPTDYLAPIKSGDGYEYFRACAAMGSRISAAIVNADRCAFILSAPTAALATVAVSIGRAAANADAIDVTVKAGTVLKASNGGRRFILTEDVFFAAADSGFKPAQAKAVAPGYEYNVRGAHVTATGDTLPGDIDTIVTLVEDPAYGDTTFEVSQDLGAGIGGTPGALEQIGLDRGLSRIDGEDVPTYRMRIRQLPDTVSRGAIDRTVANYIRVVANEVRHVGSGSGTVLIGGAAPAGAHTLCVLIESAGTFSLHRDSEPRGAATAFVAGTPIDLTGLDATLAGVTLTFSGVFTTGDIYAAYVGPVASAPFLVECFDEAYFGAWDSPDGAGPNPNFNDIASAWDSPFSDVEFTGRWVDSVDDAAAFFFVVPRLPAIADGSGAWDDPAVGPEDTVSALGSSGFSAWDIPDEVTGALPAAYDGFDASADACYFGLWALLQQVRAGGVSATVELQGA